MRFARWLKIPVSPIAGPAHWSFVMNKPVESLPAEKLEYLKRRTVICAVNPAIDALRTYYPQSAEPLKITRLYEEGAFVPDQMAIFTYSGSFAALRSEEHTSELQSRVDL